MKRETHKPFRPKGLRHPSGRPLNRQHRGVISRPRTIEDGPLTPGLRKEEGCEAIGFTVDYLPGQDDEEEWEDE